MRLSTSGRVLWLKGFYGIPDVGTTVGVNSRGAGALAALKTMGKELEGSDNAMAVYITQNATKHDYYDGHSKPGYIAGLLWLNAFAPGGSVGSYAEDTQFDIGWPVLAADSRNGPSLENMCYRLYGPLSDRILKSLRSAFQRSAPVRLDGQYIKLGSALTAHYR
jgi:hypothetical protein